MPGVCTEHSWREQVKWAEFWFKECEVRVAERIRAAIAEEREACAKIAADLEPCCGHDCRDPRRANDEPLISETIRART